LEIEALDIETLRELTAMLIMVLDSRVHRRVHLGEEIWVKGSLSQALHLPDIQLQLDSNHQARQEKAKQRLFHIWHSLSQHTREKTAKHINWYDPKTLRWDDPCSNRLPR